MELAEPGLETYLRALRNAFHRIDAFWELPDDLKDQRKFEVMADLVGQMAGYHDDESVRRVGRIAVADGLEPTMVMLVIDGAIERARLAAEWRETTAPPQRPAVVPRGKRFQLSRATLDAIDWLIAHNPDGYQAFVDGRPHEELSLIEAYLEEKKGMRHG